jgi:RND family efflux transporter MFP subunit
VVANLGATMLAAACAGNGAAPAPADGGSAARVSIGPESVVTVSTSEIRTGPLLSGELRAAREATVRAKMPGSVLDVRAEEGQAVQRGAVLARIEARPLQDALLSSQSAVRSAEQSLAVAEREADRTASLVKGGALAERDLELARTAVAGAQAQLADARARLASVRQQLDDAVITAPISGVVSGRPVNAGDVVSPGTLIATIIDPSSMLLEASVKSEALAALKLGTPVEFEVRGYPGQTFDGHIERIAPAADPVTRQVTLQNATVFYRGRGSDGRTDTLSQLDLYVQQEFRLGGQRRLQLSLNVLNLLDQDAVTGVYSQQYATNIPMTADDFFDGFDVAQLATQYGLPGDPRFLQPEAYQPTREVWVAVKLLF